MSIKDIIEKKYCDGAWLWAGRVVVWTFVVVVSGSGGAWYGSGRSYILTPITDGFIGLADTIG